MRIDVRERGGDNPSERKNPWLGRIDVDPNDRPNLVRLPAPTDRPHPGDARDRGADGDAGGAEANAAGDDAGSPRSLSVFLNWEGALDDAGQLRKCVLCDCDRLYRRKVLPQVTPFVVLLAFAGAIVGLLGYSGNPLMLPGLVVLLVIDIATLGFARERLVCYRCGSVYSKLRIARYHRRWNRTEAERVGARLGPASSGSTVASTTAS